MWASVGTGVAHMFDVDGRSRCGAVQRPDADHQQPLVVGRRCRRCEVIPVREPAARRRLDANQLTLGDG